MDVGFNVIDGIPVAAQRIRCQLQIDRVQQHEGCRHQVEEHGADQRIARFALVQPGMHAAAQFHALQPVEDKQCALGASQFAQRGGQAVLAWRFLSVLYFPFSEMTPFAAKVFADARSLLQQKFLQVGSL